MKIKKEIFFGCLIFFIAMGFFSNIFFLKIVQIEDNFFLAELALSSDKQKKGLGDRKSLCHSCAMLFNFKEKEEHAFWMKDMQFDLDILWLSEGKIIYIEKNFSHESKKIANPHLGADKILEIKAGFSDKYGFEIGDKVKIYY